MAVVLLPGPAKRNAEVRQEPRMTKEDPKRKIPKKLLPGHARDVDRIRSAVIQPVKSDAAARGPCRAYRRWREELNNSWKLR